ncbi:hypothetical protein LEP1GSC005_4123 [Leptospira santarosai str. ST188]|nr:hypothetical protein LEP1GSC005_4123 [Leptospira santarosai str. ST188]EMI64043.1 hypothetical protein LEP1GSC076_2495 [Leptospira sp. Fiocruz LV4135]EMO72498.1 hypothetical protein LEP1GSC130_0507 [Leptospira santarosai str. 200403458]EMO99882.1 hypothetical protein LEP1GSC120_1104 [Leptospira santarosai str. 200702252]
MVWTSRNSPDAQLKFRFIRSFQHKFRMLHKREFDVRNSR